MLIDEFYDFRGGVAEALPDEAILPSLPAGLRSQLDLFQKREVFTSLPFFRECTHEQVMDLVKGVGDAPPPAQLLAGADTRRASSQLCERVASPLTVPISRSLPPPICSACPLTPSLPPPPLQLRRSPHPPPPPLPPTTASPIRSSDEPRVRQVKRIYTVPGRVLIQQGHPSDGLYMITRGLVGIVDGSGEVLAERVAGEFVGESSLLDDSPSGAGASCVTMEFCEMFVLSREEFAKLVARHHDLLERIRFFATHKDDAAHQAARTKQLKLQQERFTQHPGRASVGDQHGGGAGSRLSTQLLAQARLTRRGDGLSASFSKASPSFSNPLSKARATTTATSSASPSSSFSKARATTSGAPATGGGGRTLPGRPHAFLEGANVLRRATAAPTASNGRGGDALMPIPEKTASTAAGAVALAPAPAVSLSCRWRTKAAVANSPPRKRSGSKSKTSFDGGGGSSERAAQPTRFFAGVT